METDLKESPSTSELFDETSPSKEVTSKEETSPEKKVEEKAEEKVVEEKSEKKSEEKESESKEKSEEKSDETKDEASSDTTDKPSTEKSTDWEKRFKDTETSYQNLNQEVVKLKEENSKFKQDLGIEEDDTTVSDERKRAKERAETSEAIERQNHGDEYIEKMLYAPDSIWQKVKNDPIIDFRVSSSLSPATEALIVVKETEFHDKYGKDPDKIVEKIREEERPKLMKELKEDYEKKLKDNKSLGTDLSDVENDEVKGKKSAKTESTKDLFG